MKCPYCAHLGDKVVDSRESKEGEVIRRRRECLGCGKRFTSYERIDQIPHLVVKKDGRRERFDREVPTVQIGEFLMDRLKELDKVAFVRFASVYRDFKDVDQFMATLKGLL